MYLVVSECVYAFVIKIKSTLRVIIENEFSLKILTLGNGVEDYEIYTGCEHNKTRKKNKEMFENNSSTKQIEKKSRKSEEIEREKKNEEGQGHSNKIRKTKHSFIVFDLIYRMESITRSA